MTTQTNRKTTTAIENTPTLDFSRKCLLHKRTGVELRKADRFREDAQALDAKYRRDITKDESTAFYIANARLMLALLAEELDGNDVVALYELAHALRDSPIAAEFLANGAELHTAKAGK